MLNIYLYLKYNFLKYKYYFIFGFIFLLLVFYFIFFREIRNVDISWNNYYENSDIVFDYDIRSKSKIESINIEVTYDFDILNEFKYKNEYLKFLSENGFFYTIPCDKHSCNWSLKIDHIYDSFLDYVNNFKKIDVYNELISNIEKQSWNDTLNSLNQENESQSWAFITENYTSNINDDWKYDNMVWIDYNQEVEKIVLDCNDEKFEFDYNCYTTPEMNINFKWVTLEYSIKFKNWKTEIKKQNFYKDYKINLNKNEKK